MSTSQTSSCAGHSIAFSADDRTVLRQRSRRLRRLFVAIIIIACTVAVARGKTAAGKSQHEGHPSLRKRIACMC